jgi:hypothetical protein
MVVCAAAHKAGGGAEGTTANSHPGKCPDYAPWSSFLLRNSLQQASFEEVCRQISHMCVRAHTYASIRYMLIAPNNLLSKQSAQSPIKEPWKVRALEVDIVTQQSGGSQMNVRAFDNFFTDGFAAPGRD